MLTCRRSRFEPQLHLHLPKIRPEIPAMPTALERYRWRVATEQLTDSARASIQKELGISVRHLGTA
jgi:hypothetical protein